MISFETRSVVIAGVVLALWLVAAVAATALGLARARRARAVEAEAERLQGLIARAPALYLGIDRDGRIEGLQRLADWLGLERLPRFLADLPDAGAAIADAQLAEFVADIDALRHGGRGFVRTLAVQESTRVLVVRGRPGPDGGAELWVADESEGVTEIAALEQERERLGRAIEAIAALIEAAPFPMWHRGPDLQLALVNGAYTRAVEAADATEVVTRGLELAEGEGGGGPLAGAAEARANDRVSIRTVPAILGGQRRTIQIVDVPLGEAGVAGYAIDVEELEEARADLARLERAQRDLLDRLSAGVAQFGPDRSLVFTNEPFRRLFALRPEWLADAPEFDRVLERMREADRAPESRDFPRWKTERRAWFTTPEGVEETWLLPGGTHLRVLAQPLPAGGLLLIFEDRTEQVQLASARDTLLRVRTATFDNLFEAIGVFAADGRLQLWNTRFKEVWGLNDAELARHLRVDALVDRVAKLLEVPKQASLIRELVRIATLERRQRSGRVAFADGRHFEFAAVPLPDGNALFTMLDISASRQIEAALRERTEALEEADRVKTAFVAKMSYELRVPLTSIAGFAEMLGKGYAGVLPAPAEDYVGAILTSTARLGALIEDVLDWTQSEAGSLPLAEAEIDAGGLGREAAAAAADGARAKPLELVVDVAPDLGALAGDARRLRQALDHVLRNAVGYTPPGGRVLFRATGDVSAVEFVVSDNGPGIALRDQPGLFDRFQQGAARTGERAQLGLGLPLTRRLIEAHGGTVTLASEPGEGTTVILRVPRRRGG